MTMMKGAQILVECLPGPPLVRAGAGKREGVARSVETQ